MYICKPIDKAELQARVKVGSRIVALEEKLEERAKKAEGRFQDLFDNSLEGILYIESDRQKIGILGLRPSSVNRSLCSLLDYKKKELLGTKLEEIVHPGDLKRFQAHLDKIGSHDQNTSIEIKLKRNDGNSVWVKNTITLLADPRKDVLTILFIMTDITAEKTSYMEIMRRSFEYKLEEGNIYGALDGKHSVPIRCFKDLLSIGYEGIILSRRTEDEIRKHFKGEYRFFRFTSDIKENDDTLKKMTDLLIGPLISLCSL